MQLEARGREFKHCFDLFPGDSRKPLDELIDGCSVFQILEQGPYRNPRVRKHPRAAHLLRVALDRSAFFPRTREPVPPNDYGIRKLYARTYIRVNGLRVHNRPPHGTPEQGRPFGSYTAGQPCRHRHYTGNEHTVLGVARHSETLEEFVVYG